MNGADAILHITTGVVFAAIAAIQLGLDRRATAPDEVAATGAEGLGAVRARAAEDRQLHSHASTVSTSGPRNRAPSVRNVAASIESAE